MANATVRTKAKPTNRAKTAAALAAVTVEIDRALKQRWTSLSTEVEDARREGASAFDRLWEAVAEIIEHDPPLYLAGGFATARAYLAARLGEPERSARRNIRIAKYASPGEEVRYGPSKLDAAIAYVEAKAGGGVKGRVPIDFSKLRVPVDKDGRSQRVSLDAATVEQITAATRALLRQEARPAVKSSPVVKAIVKQLASRVLRDIKVRIVGGKVSLSDIEPQSVTALGKALARVILPAAK